MAQEKILGRQLNLTDVAAELPTKTVNDTSPQLGGDLDANGYSIITLGTSGGSPTTKTTNDVVIRTGNANNAGYGYAGDVSIVAGTGSADYSEGGNVLIFGGNSAVAENLTNSATYGAVFIYGGRQEYSFGGRYAGAFRFAAGDALNGNFGGYVKLYAGDSNGSGGAGGNMNLYAGNGAGGADGGAVRIRSGSGDRNGSIQITAGATSGTNKPSSLYVRGGGANGEADGGDIEIEAGATSGSPAFVGGDIKLKPGKRFGVSDNSNAGSVQLHAAKDNTGQGELQFWYHTNTAHTTGNYVALKAPTNFGSPISDVTFTLPGVDGNNGDVLQTDGAGNLTFAAGGAGGVTNPMTSNLDTGGYSIVTANATGSPASANDINITSGSTTYASASSYAGKVTIKGGDRAYTGSGATTSDYVAVEIRGGNGGYAAGYVNLYGGTAGGAYVFGGGIGLYGGENSHADGYGGSIYINAAHHTAYGVGSPRVANGGAGDINLFAGGARDSQGGHVDIRAGHTYPSGYALPGNVKLHGGQINGNTTTAGWVGIYGGTGASVASSTGGDVKVYGGTAGSTGTGGAVKLRGGTATGGTKGKVDIYDVGTFVSTSEVAVGTGTTVNWQDGPFQSATPSGATTYSFTSVAGPSMLTLKLTNGSGNNPTWPAGVRWIGGTEPTWTAGTDIITFYYDGSLYHGVNVALGLA